MKKAIVIGSGAGGAMVAKELQGHFQVTILEAGGEFQPFAFPVDKLAGQRGHHRPGGRRVPVHQCSLPMGHAGAGAG